MVHAVYSDRDVFLRELIANAADACEKLRMTALQNDQAGSNGVPAQYRSTTNVTTRATRTEAALRRLVSMIAATPEFIYR